MLQDRRRRGDGARAVHLRGQGQASALMVPATIAGAFTEAAVKAEMSAVWACKVRFNTQFVRAVACLLPR